MTRPGPLRPTLAVGFDVVLAVDPSIYEITEDATGRAWVFAMDEETRGDVADAVEAALAKADGLTPRAVARLDVTAGYLRVRYRPPGRDAADPFDLLEALESTPEIYNDAHATDAELDGFALEEESYLGTYRPEDAAEREPFMERHATGEALPEADGPVWSHHREAAGEDVLTADRRFSYEFLLAFDAPEMYDPDTAPLATADALPVEWDHDGVREVLDLVVRRKPPLWPGRPENTPRVEIHPGFVAVDHTTTDAANPVTRAETVRDALLEYNRYRTPAEDRRRRQETPYHPPIGFDGSVYIRAVDHGRTAAEWIREHELDAVDGAPIDTEADADPDAEEPGRLDALNPFS